MYIGTQVSIRPSHVGLRPPQSQTPPLPSNIHHSHYPRLPSSKAMDEEHLWYDAENYFPYHFAFLLGLVKLGMKFTVVARLGVSMPAGS